MNNFWNLTQTFNDTALFSAAEKGHTEIVEILLNQEDIDINMKDILNKKTIIIFKSNFFIILKK